MIRAITATRALAFGLVLLLAGCGNEDDKPLAAAQPITDGDSCHVCGMLIAELPGPKGQAYLNRDDAVRKFCSTTDMFAFLLQPENESRLSHAWVHDVAVTPWSQPADDAFILASEAWYVAGHDRRGAMGHTLASFKERHHAEAFAETHGGEVLAFGDIDLALLTDLARADAGMQHGGGMPDHGAMPGHDNAHGH
ncbi:nitrous oxide reductase accessory protein NosL [Halomonas sp. MCCC 1A11036]|uniref:Nitrous oxide reductase accessory protein NosL n=1 Tax=Billgrantia zhangzhouensis TaxID=2733481 RepID=A0ABS9AJ70_9GAMM|nr:nitrous oxide reductase accessory protein NosL [Halomonas zhangzhouensis]MCE8021784.1 nitrous oxide reductase accessory protein NosL [Halomonas zhangzhouensis]